MNESVVADALICGDEKAVYADKGYENKDRIMHRSHRNQDGLPHGRSGATR